MYKVKIRIPDLVLEQLTTEQFQEFRDRPSARLLGFTEYYSCMQYCDYPYCDKVFIVRTEQVVKPSLFGHVLPYTAEVI